ncbi:phage tail protein [Roseovarius pacificus]|uniref:phage tail protein n=1 Tax=Roseovarius pacificus TaxID=337701 RepID=UPI002A18D0CE|nr:phage tail protein [Roseovarius pacificus]
MPAFSATFMAAVSVGNSVLATLGVTTSSLALIAGTGFLTQAAAGYALHALSPKPKVSTHSGVRGFQVNAKGTTADHQVIYGEALRAGLIYDLGSGGGPVNNLYHRIYVHAGHPIEGYVGCVIGNEVVTQWRRTDTDEVIDDPSQAPNGTPIVPAKVAEIGPDGVPGKESARYDPTVGFGGGVYFRFYDGTQTEADSNLVARVPAWTPAHVGRDLSFVCAEFVHGSGGSWPNGLPEIKFKIRGKRLYDPRTGLTEWSANAALCVRDYIASKYGLNEPAERIDDARFRVAADVCDEIAANGKRRYTCNGAFLTSVQPVELLPNLITCFAGWVWPAQGKWRIRAGHYVAPTMTLTENDLRGPVSVDPRHSMRKNFNTVRGNFSGPESNWQPDDYPQVTSPAFLAEDGGEEKVADFDLPFTDNTDEARRLARIFLERNRQQLTVSASWSIRAMRLQVGDIVQLSLSRFGWLVKKFEVASWSFSIVDLKPRVALTLREISASVFDEVDDGAVYARDNSSLLGPFYVPAVGIGVASRMRIANEKVTNVAEITLTSSDPDRIFGLELQYKKSSASDWTSAGRTVLGKTDIVDLETGFYDFRAVAFNSFETPGEYTVTSNREINPYVSPPEDVTGVQRELSGGSIFLSWNAVGDLDLSFYRVKHNPATSGATWGNSSTVIAKVPRPATSASLPARSGTFLFKAFDKEGNESVNATPLIVQPVELPPLGFSIEVVESPEFDGAGANIEFDSGAIRIDDTTGAQPSGEYLFDVDGVGHVDTGSSRSVRITGGYAFTRKFDGAQMVWSDIPGNFLSWPGKFSTWTDEEAPFGDVGVRVLVSATHDDPTGAPTWGPYELANGAFVNGRAFRFKAVLDSDSKKFTPNVTELTVKVEY